MELKNILVWIMIGIIIIITLFLCFIYIVSKSFRSFPCYLNIILSFSILMDNLLRLISVFSKISFFCYFQAIGLAIFDKFMTAVITVNAYLTYVGFTHNDFYKQYQKLLFIISITIALLVSVILALVFISQGEPSNWKNVCYVQGTTVKEVTDAIVTVILACINFFCIVSLLLHIVSIIKEISTFRNKNDYVRHYYRMIGSLFISGGTFLIVILIIADSLSTDDDFIDLCYIIDALVVDLFYTCNKTVINETKKLFGIVPEGGDISEDGLSSENADRTDSISED